MDDRNGYTPEERSVYSDAYYRQASDTSGYGYNLAQCYARVSEGTPPEKKAARRHPSAGMFAAMCVICVLLAGLLGSGGMFFVFRADAAGSDDAPSRELYEIYSDANRDAVAAALPLMRAADADREEMSAEQIYSRACQSTVGVTVPGYAYNIFGQSGASAVIGSGIVLSEDGYILTNYHVIEDAYENGAEVQVINYDGESFLAEIHGVETDSDMAILKIDADGLTPAVFGDSDDMRVGQTIYAVGNPLGELTYTMTSGIVSALDRNVTTDVDVTVNMFQIDAAVNNGNSGGPVYNAFGQVIGVVTAKYSLYGIEGLGFAIPINDARVIANELVEKGYVSGKAYLGLTPVNVSPSVARYYNMVQGVYVYDVEDGSCAQNAGLRTGDIITAIDDTEIQIIDDLVRAVKQYRAGDTAELTIYRGKEYMTVTVLFDEVLPARPMTSEEAVRRDAGSLIG